MRKYLFLLLALLLVVGVANAANVPKVVDPRTGPEVWTVPVYNNNTSTLNAGDLVVWAIADSSGDDDNWVTLTNTADTGHVAGVVYPAAIAAYTNGTIAIRGPVSANVTGSFDAYHTVCSSSTVRTVAECTTGSEASAIGVFVATGATSTAQIMLY